MSAVPFRSLSCVREIAGDYDAFILDLWGVIHDGFAAFPHSADTLRALKAAGKKTMLLSNAPRRPGVLIDHLAGMGIPRDLYGEVMSSGEAMRLDLIARRDPAFAALGDTCYHIGPDRDLSVFDDVPVRRVALEDAAFIVNTGPTDLTHGLDLYRDILAAGAARALPMICANPDKLVIRQGQPVMCAGAMADEYIRLGGTVINRGKPDAAVYHTCLSVLGVDPTRVCVVGDSLETDVQGAANAGLDCLFVTGGIHAATLGCSYGVAADPAKVQALLDGEGLSVTATVGGFIWSV